MDSHNAWIRFWGAGQGDIVAAWAAKREMRKSFPGRKDGINRRHRWALSVSSSSATSARSSATTYTCTHSPGGWPPVSQTKVASRARAAAIELTVVLPISAPPTEPNRQDSSNAPVGITPVFVHRAVKACSIEGSVRRVPIGCSSASGRKLMDKELPVHVNIPRLGVLLTTSGP